MTPSDLVALVARLRATVPQYYGAWSIIQSLQEEAAAAIEQLQAEVESWKMKFEQSNSDRIRILNEIGEEKVQRQWTTVENERDALRAELAAVKQDAERYRWLKHGDNDSRCLVGSGDEVFLLREGKLDAEIDAARAQAGGK